MWEEDADACGDALWVPEREGARRRWVDIVYIHDVTYMLTQQQTLTSTIHSLCDDLLKESTDPTTVALATNCKCMARVIAQLNSRIEQKR